MAKRSYSHSMRAAYSKCPRYFKFAFVDGLGTPPSADMSFGTGIHTGSQAYLEGDDGSAVFKLYWESEKGRDIPYNRYGWKEYLEMGIEFMRKFEKWVPKFKPYKMEERIFTEIGGVKMEGTIDFAGDFDGVPSVLDFKTTAYAYPKEKIVCDDQMPLYSQLAKTAWGYEAKQLVYFPFVKSNTSIQTPMKADLSTLNIAGTMENVVSQCNMIEADKVFPQNRGACMMGKVKCPFFDRCHSKVEE